MADLKKFEFEIMNIISKLESLEEGYFYEVDRKPGVASAKTIARNIKTNFIDLIEKIIDDKESTSEMLRKLKY